MAFPLSSSPFLAMMSIIIFSLLLWLPISADESTPSPSYDGLMKKTKLTNLKREKRLRLISEAKRDPSLKPSQPFGYLEVEEEELEGEANKIDLVFEQLLEHFSPEKSDPPSPGKPHLEKLPGILEPPGSFLSVGAKVSLRDLTKACQLFAKNVRGKTLLFLIAGTTKYERGKLESLQEPKELLAALKTFLENAEDNESVLENYGAREYTQEVQQIADDIVELQKAVLSENAPSDSSTNGETTPNEQQLIALLILHRLVLASGKDRNNLNRLGMLDAIAMHDIETWNKVFNKRYLNVKKQLRCSFDKSELKKTPEENVYLYERESDDEDDGGIPKGVEITYTYEKTLKESDIQPDVYRVLQATATLSPGFEVKSNDNRDTDDYSRVYARALGKGFPESDSYLSDQAGHIIANAMGGPACSYNLFPQSIVSNTHQQSEWKRAERYVTQVHNNKVPPCTTVADISFEYENSPKTTTRPTGGTYVVAQFCGDKDFEILATFEWGNSPVKTAKKEREDRNKQNMDKKKLKRRTTGKNHN